MKRVHPEFPAIVQGGNVHLGFPKIYRAYVARFEGEEVMVGVWKKRSKRSLKQNAALHAALGHWALEMGHDVEQLKDDLLALQFGYVVRQNQFTGEIIKTLVKPHTSKLNTVEFTELFDRAAVEAAQEGHVMQMPDEYTAAKEAVAKKAARDAAKAQRAA